jgi:hypothetical protein
MKRFFKGAMLALATVSIMASCVSKPETTENTVEEMADKMVVADWANRGMGEEAQPTWLKAMIRGNSGKFKETFGIDPERIVKTSRATGNTEAVAQAFSRAGFAYSQAAELQQKVIGRVGQGLNDVGQLEAVYMAASETKAEMSGLREETTFWQKVRVKNAENGKVTEEYVYYTIYSMDKETWDNICKKYLMDIMGDASLQTETQKKIGELFSEIKEDSDKKDLEKAEAERKAYEAQLARIDLEKTKVEASVQKADAEAQTAQAVARALELEAMLK